ncbi:hypothetical protein OH799_33940 [Nocardia sp. NBC_00881]|nr:hypothetical protein OH799_33940 [Nocardia sp. NBC_00881]
MTRARPVVAQVFDSGGGQAFGFVDDEQFDQHSISTMITLFPRHPTA